MVYAHTPIIVNASEAKLEPAAMGCQGDKSRTLRPVKLTQTGLDQAYVMLTSFPPLCIIEFPVQLGMPSAPPAS